MAMYMLCLKCLWIIIYDLFEINFVNDGCRTLIMIIGCCSTFGFNSNTLANAEEYENIMVRKCTGLSCWGKFIVLLWLLLKSIPILSQWSATLTITRLHRPSVEMFKSWIHKWFKKASLRFLSLRISEFPSMGTTRFTGAPWCSHSLVNGRSVDGKTKRRTIINKHS